MFITSPLTCYFHTRQCFSPLSCHYLQFRTTFNPSGFFFLCSWPVYIHPFLTYLYHFTTTTIITTTNTTTREPLITHLYQTGLPHYISDAAITTPMLPLLPPRYGNMPTTDSAFVLVPSDWCKVVLVDNYSSKSTKVTHFCYHSSKCYRTPRCDVPEIYLRTKNLVAFNTSQKKERIGTSDDNWSDRRVAGGGGGVA